MYAQIYYYSNVGECLTQYIQLHFSEIIGTQNSKPGPDDDDFLILESSEVCCCNIA